MPYHWIEVGNMLLDAASDDLVDPDQIRRLLKDLREVRMSKMRSGVDVLDAAATGGGGVALTGVGAMELGEERGFLTGVVDNLRYDTHDPKDSRRLFILIKQLGKSEHQKSKLGENSWPSNEQMAGTTVPKTKKRITWSFKRCMEEFILGDLTVFSLAFKVHMRRGSMPPDEYSMYIDSYTRLSWSYEKPVIQTKAIPIFLTPYSMRNALIKNESVGRTSRTP